MKVNELFEATVTGYEKEDHNVDSLIKLLNAHCKDALKAGSESEESQLWRGTKSKHKSGIFRPGSGERKSQNTQNFYTALLDSNPLNKEFPLRSKSFIGTTLRNRAANYSTEMGNREKAGGTVLALFPYDGTPIGQCNTSDIWNCRIKFPKYGLDETIASMNHFWVRFMQLINQPDEVPTMPQMIELLKANEEVIDDVFSDDTSSLPSFFIEAMPKAYSYKSMGCELTNPGEVQHKNSEIWFSGPCVGVTQDDWRAIAEEFKL